MLWDDISTIRVNDQYSYRGQEAGNASVHLGTVQSWNMSSIMRLWKPLATYASAVRIVLGIAEPGLRQDLWSPETHEQGPTKESDVLHIPRCPAIRWSYYRRSNRKLRRKRADRPGFRVLTECGHGRSAASGIFAVASHLDGSRQLLTMLLKALLPPKYELNQAQPFLRDISVGVLRDIWERARIQAPSRRSDTGNTDIVQLLVGITHTS